MFGSSRASSIGLLELGRQCAKMPLAKMSCCVALGLEDFCQGDFLRWEMPCICRVDPIAVRMSSSQAASSRRAAQGGTRVEAGEVDARFSHLVEVGGLYGRVAVTPHIPPPEVIRHAQDHVGFGGGGREKASEGGKENGKDGESSHLRGMLRGWG